MPASDLGWPEISSSALSSSLAVQLRARDLTWQTRVVSNRDNPRRLHFAGIGPIAKKKSPPRAIQQFQPAGAGCCPACPAWPSSARYDVGGACQGPHDGPSKVLLRYEWQLCRLGRGVEARRSTPKACLWWCGSAIFSHSLHPLQLTTPTPSTSPTHRSP